MQATAQVIERNQQQFTEHQRLLVFGQPENEALSFLNYEKALTFDYRVYCSLTDSLANKIEFTLNPVLEELFDAVIIFLPKAKEELELALAYLTPMLAINASIYLVGEKKAGIASAAKKLAKYSDNSSKLDSAKHCQLWQANFSEKAKAFCINDWMDSYKVALGDIELEVVTIPGVFSYGRLDDGTEMLLKSMPSNLKGRVVDFGCGSGVIGAYAAKKNASAELELVDINLLAIECATQTLSRNGIKASVYPSDAWSEVKGRVNAVLTNPPFHSGVKTEYSTTENFIRVALDKMTKHAPMIIVANSFLKYGPIMEQSFGSYVILEENRKFRLYQVRR